MFSILASQKERCVFSPPVSTWMPCVWTPVSSPTEAKRSVSGSCSTWPPQVTQLIVLSGTADRAVDSFIGGLLPAPRGRCVTTPPRAPSAGRTNRIECEHVGTSAGTGLLTCHNTKDRFNTVALLLTLACLDKISIGVFLFKKRKEIETKRVCLE